jgi:DNA mismatch endonuclease (patch repair protein)
MGRIRGKDTAPERALRSAVWRSGGRFRVHVKGLPGSPDLANRRAKVAVFVDGCFWHGCRRHFRPPRTRREFWAEKIRRNVANRRRHLAEYPPDWQVFQVYECQVRDRLDHWSRRIVRAMAK